MCSPREYRIGWEINPKMDKNNQPGKERAFNQWYRLFKIYLDLGIGVSLTQPSPGFCDMVFTANAGWGRKNKFLLSNFKHEERRPESKRYREWLLVNSFKICELPEGIFFEGQGDFVSTDECYLMGYGQRSSLESADFIKRCFRLEKPVIPLRLVNPKFYHLDTCLMYVKPINTILYYPKAFDRDSQEKIKSLNAKTIVVTDKEADSYICNGVYFKNTILLTGKTSRIAYLLRKKGLKAISLNTSEFDKSGAGIRCLTLFLD